MQKQGQRCLLTISEQKEGLIIELSGEIDHHSAVWVRTEIDEMIAEVRPERVLMDLSGIDFMDSSGIGLIMGRHARAKAVGGVLYLRNPNERVLRIFKLAGLDKIVEIESKGGKKK